MIKRDYKTRIVIVFSFFLVMYLVIIIRLFLIQIFQKDFFALLARHQYHIDITIDPPRGLIVDRHGQVLALNRERPSAFVLSYQCQKSAMQAFLQRYYPQIYQKMKQHPTRKFFWLERKLRPKQLKELKNRMKKCQVEEVQFIKESQRFYPYKELAHVLGFTDIDNQGIAGTEKLFSPRLQGSATTVMLQKDARRRNFYFEKVIKKQGNNGLPVALTIDKTLQFLAYEHLKETVKKFEAKRGSVLIMNPDSGEILVMANYPTFDPNKKLPTLLDVTKNNIVTECFELGSVVKMFAALAALEEGVVTMDELIDCEGKITFINGFRVENWKSVNVIPFADVLKFSSNVAIAKVAQRLDAKLYDHLRRLGFGKKTNIQFIGERDGFVNPPHNWSRSSSIVMSFGYEIMASLLQLGVATSIIANGGHSVQPVLVKNEQHIRQKLYKDETIVLMKDMLARVGQRYSVPGYKVMGKTGTARLVKDGAYSTKDHVYTFAGIVEQGDYRRVLVTFVQEPVKANLWAAEVSAPLFQQVAEKMVLYEFGHDTQLS